MAKFSERLKASLAYTVKEFTTGSWGASPHHVGGTAAYHGLLGAAALEVVLWTIKTSFLISLWSEVWPYAFGTAVVVASVYAVKEMAIDMQSDSNDTKDSFIDGIATAFFGTALAFSPLTRLIFCYWQHVRSAERKLFGKGKENG